MLLDGFDHGERRSALDERVRERGDIAGLALDLDDDAVGRVGDETAECELVRELVDVRSEPDALHDSPHDQAVAHDGHRAGSYVVRSFTREQNH
ncbi:MAG: hypothetical protein WKF58_05625 [Ilumatobacteraceae bacterium]